MIIDAHHYLWDPTRRTYPWLDDPMLLQIRRPYTVADLRTATRGQSQIRTVLVQTMADQAETIEFLATAAASNGLIVGVVGWVDLTAPDLPEQLAGLRAAPGGNLLVGIRHLVRDARDPAWLTRPQVLRGIRAVGDAGLAIDLLVRGRQLEMVQQVAALLPGVNFILNDLGKPPIATGHWQPWAWQIAAIAKLPNVVAKLSGLVTADRWSDWDTEHLIPYATLALELFGPERLMFGSDWPICTLAASYPETFAVAEQLCGDLSTAECAALFSGTARRAYRLN